MYTSPIWNLYEDGITQSMIATFLACPEKFKIGAIDALRGNYEGSSKPMMFGTVFHEVKDRIYTDLMKCSKEDKDQFIQQIPEFVKDHLTNIYETQLEELKRVPTGIEAFNDMNWVHATVEVVLLEYFKFYETIDLRNREWVALEHEFDYKHTLSSGRAIRRRGKVDGIFKQDDMFWEMENKTRGRIDTNSVLETVNMNLQTNYYLDAIENDFGPVGGLVYNLVKRPSATKKVSQSWDDYKDELAFKIEDNPRDYFARVNVSFKGDDREAWKRDIATILDKIDAWYQGEFHYRNPLSCISQYGQLCPYRNLCSYNDNSGLVPRDSMFNELETEE